MKLYTKLLGVGAIILVIILLAFSSKLVENNKNTDVLFVTGIMGGVHVHTTPGPKGQRLGSKTAVPIIDMIYFSKNVEDGGNKDTSVPVKFNGGGKGWISGTCTYALPMDEAKLRLIYREKKNSRTIKYLVEKHIQESIIAASTVVKAGEAYAERRSEFIALAENMAKNGIYATKAVDLVVPDPADPSKNMKEKIVQVVTANVTGVPVISKESPLNRYGITLTQFGITDLVFDEQTERMIGQEKEVEQERKLAAKQAETAKQQAETEKQKAKQNLAKAQGIENIEKMKEVTKALKAKEVAEMKAAQELAVAKLAKEAKIQQGQQALEMAKLAKQAKQQDAVGIKALADANSYRAAKMSKAGLTPLEKATIEKDTRVGVARELAKLNLPNVMISGSGGKGGTVDPFTAIGLESLMKINDKLVGAKRVK